MTVSHARKFKITYRNDRTGSLGTMLLGIGPEAIDFLPYEDDGGNGVLTLGELRINAAHRGRYENV